MFSWFKNWFKTQEVEVKAEVVPLINRPKPLSQRPLTTSMRSVTPAPKVSQPKVSQPSSEVDELVSSMALGYVTNNGMVGGLLGGDLIGGMLGDALNTEDSAPITSPSEPSRDVGVSDKSDCGSVSSYESHQDVSSSSDYSSDSSSNYDSGSDFGGGDF